MYCIFVIICSIPFHFLDFQSSFIQSAFQFHQFKHLIQTTLECLKFWWRILFDVCYKISKYYWIHILCNECIMTLLKELITFNSLNSKGKSSLRPAAFLCANGTKTFSRHTQTTCKVSSKAVVFAMESHLITATIFTKLIAFEIRRFQSTFIQFKSTFWFNQFNSNIKSRQPWIVWIPIRGLVWYSILF